MRLSILAVGRLKSGPERELVERYRQRIEAMGRSLGLTGLEMVELPESRARREDDRRAEEAAALLEKAGAAFLVAFDERGRSPSSEAFAERLRQWRDEGCPGIACVIGGPDGLDPVILKKARAVISFGALTMPHQIVRALVAEQLYRALTIIAGHPYHRAGHDDS
ncbi:23S rRNA (pseudouridine(1915)-N(3))-methyltransferase RlmH [Microvirga thermotolerans]|uniref:Ribosomal RNA large subunit methyltransferase H n=1 Tax=Microvirga thermotolerans TaxID=2651334 RepID=A0A5P9JSG3_9HYPH|nr:23S rRNA (pseudouridine(1915)-N(3))-methyltransferase RlmH [Microvirga thermotolerans]QFU15333.1 23S rRNA (pseudouridine(1915)-N(3))-methyltransferase RlmH [Microvirga thermotolerans]